MTGNGEKNLKAVVVIPARFKSSRYPGKPLVRLLGKPMIQWVAELSAAAVGEKNVYIATDTSEIKNFVESIGYQVLMTPESCLTGTDRLASIVELVKADIYVNVQGDEPMVKPSDITRVINTKKNNPDHVINCYTNLLGIEDPENPNIPKVAISETEDLVYMSRSVIPGTKKQTFKSPEDYLKQVCIYAFNKTELQAFWLKGRKSALELEEDIEILRFIDLGIPVKMIKVDSGSLAVDVPEDVPVVEAALRAYKNAT